MNMNSYIGMGDPRDLEALTKTYHYPFTSDAVGNKTPSPGHTVEDFKPSRTEAEEVQMHARDIALCADCVTGLQELQRSDSRTSEPLSRRTLKRLGK